MNTNQTDLQSLKHQYRLRRIGEVGLFAVGGALLIGSLLVYLRPMDWISWSGMTVFALLLFAFRYRQLGLHRLTEREIATYLSRQFPKLEDSTDLLVTPDEQLRPVQQLQRQRLATVIGAAAKEVSWPHQWPAAISLLLFGLLNLVIALLWMNAQPNATSQPQTAGAALPDTTAAAVMPAELEDYTIRIQPPAYTGRRASNAAAFNLEVPEGSTISWQLRFSGSPEAVKLVFSTGDSLRLNEADGVFTASRAVRQAGFYSLQWMDEEKQYTSDFYKLGVIEDQPPQLNIGNQPQFVELPWDEDITLTVEAGISDDYGLTEAYAIATVSKGSGESVKFREERLPFTQPARIAGRQLQAKLTLNTRELGMEPGDELYYYLQAWDNRAPRRQSNRTETFFVALQDTSTQMISFEGGLGVDLMPEYFRSQRQIIIDSEKLLAEKGRIEKEAFDGRSNNLAHDQKVLRLRYGQFLGEEFESGMTSEPEPDADAAPANEAEVLEQFGHDHDNDNEHNLVEEAHDHDHDHDHGESANPEEQEESPLEAFVHSHDNMEEATFFIRSVKAKLRAALSLMWDAELHLRMNDPAASLPYQYKILKLLKEISQDSRIYVHRTGFDAPPLKEEKRLSGDLEEIVNSQTAYQRRQPLAYPAVRRAAPLIEAMLHELPETLSATDRELLAAAGNELAAAAIEQPDRYLEPLSTLKQLLDGALTPQNLRRIRAAFWQLLPDLPRAPANIRTNDHTLQRAFIEQLKARR